MIEWHVTFAPVSRNPGERAGTNESGLVVLLSDGEEDHEVSRVAFSRKDSRNPDKSFEEAMEAEVDKAQRAVEALNAALDEFEALREQEKAVARDALHDILGDRREGLE